MIVVLIDGILKVVYCNDNPNSLRITDIYEGHLGDVIKFRYATDYHSKYLFVMIYTSSGIHYVDTKNLERLEWIKFDDNITNLILSSLDIYVKFEPQTILRILTYEIEVISIFLSELKHDLVLVFVS